MKKTLTINLNSRVFNIDEDAYTLLDNYLKNLKTYFSKTDGSNEIMNDFEARIGEIFGAKIAQGYDVINIDDVEQTIAQMGRPSDFDENQEKESAFEQFAANQNSSSNAQNDGTKQRKRLFRDPQNKMLGGVCSGIAAYFGWDASVLRIILVVLAIFSRITLLIPYLIMWLLVPEARTAEQQLQMRGEPINLENIGKTVAAQSNVTVNQAQNGGCLTTFLKFCLICLGIIFAPVLFAIVVVVIALIATLLGVSTGILGGLIPWTSDTFLFVQHPAIATIALCLFIGIPLMALLYWICQKLFHWGKTHIAIKIAGLIIWLASIVMVPFAGWNVNWQELKNKTNWNFGWGNFQLDKKNVSGDGNLVERTFNYSQNVNKIFIRNNLNVDLQIDSVKSNKTELAITTDSNLIDLVNINVSGNTLTLSPKRNYNLVPSAPIVIKLNINELNYIELNGASTLNIPNTLKVNDLEIEVSGSSDLKIANITANKIECEASGASEATFAGNAKNFEVKANGASSITADKLICENVEADASGASSISCNATNSLSADSSGASTIYYFGTPKTISKDTSGAGRVEPK